MSQSCTRAWMPRPHTCSLIPCLALCVRGCPWQDICTCMYMPICPKISDKRRKFQRVCRPGARTSTEQTKRRQEQWERTRTGKVDWNLLVDPKKLISTGRSQLESFQRQKLTPGWGVGCRKKERVLVLRSHEHRRSRAGVCDDEHQCCFQDQW